EDPEEESKGDPKEDPIDYAIDADDDEDEEESSEDDDDEEEDHLAPADLTVVASSAVDHVPSAEETDPFKTDEFPHCHYLYHRHPLLALLMPRNLWATKQPGFD
nr:hypothetical protein [Tanacetum cinerariifolium]